MAHVTRRFFLLSSAALSVGCAVRSPGADVAPPAVRDVRRPVPGQSWRYVRSDIFTRNVVDEQLNQVSTVDHTVEIAASYEVPAKAQKSGWGTALLQKYTGHQPAASNGTLPSEIQDPWGMVAVDPHWGQVQVYETPIPLWPTVLEPGWVTRISTNYKTPAYQVPLPWDQTMRAVAWEMVTVPAGQFKALRFTNSIKFKHSDFTRTDSVRQETIWFAPQVGRWIARESQGTYYLSDSTIVTPYNETGYRWELLEWS